MVFYNWIDSNTTEGERTAERLLKLREALDREIPQRDIAGSLVLATWNTREFIRQRMGHARTSSSTTSPRSLTISTW
jgi:hypothetical protein